MGLVGNGCIFVALMVVCNAVGDKNGNGDDKYWLNVGSNYRLALLLVTAYVMFVIV